MKIAPLPAGEALCPRYTVTLNGQAAPVAAARVSAMPFNCGWPGHQRPLDQTEIAGFVSCEADGPVTVQVTVADTVRETRLRPLAENIAVETDGSICSFTLPGPGQYVLEPNDHHEALHLFVSPLITVPAADENTLYYGPGIHNIGLVELRSGQTVIIDAGAVVYGGFVAFDCENITFTGTGILDGSWEKRTSDSALIPWRSNLEDLQKDPEIFLHTDRLRAFIARENVLNGCIRLYGCRNCSIEHITFRDSSTFTVVPAACENIVIDDVKLIGMWRYNSDGIDPFNCSNLVIRNSFLRNFDDCVVLKGISGFGCLPMRNILVENCVLWCDWGRALEIGAETNASEYANILFRDCDVIHGTWLQLDIQHHNNAYIHDVIFEDIRCEYTRHQQPLKFQESMDQTFDEAPVTFEHPALLGAFFYDMGLFGWRHGDEKMARIIFKDIQVLCDEEIPMPGCRFTGLNETNKVTDVLLENITRNGVRLTTAQAANLSWNEFAENIVLK